MKTRPILMNGEMIRATLAGHKTQTRRIVRAKDADPSRCIALPTLMQNVAEWREQNGRWFGIDGYDTLVFCDCPYGRAGDRLWVRESHALLTMLDGAEVCAYRASCDDNTFNYVNEFTGNVHCIEVEKWRPSIHMPRKASRITLKVVDVRVKRLQNISRGDCMAEGCPFPNIAKETNPIEWFADLWESINGPESWGANPWAWCVEFKRIES